MGTAIRRGARLMICSTSISTFRYGFGRCSGTPYTDTRLISLRFWHAGECGRVDLDVATPAWHIEAATASGGTIVGAATQRAGVIGFGDHEGRRSKY